MKADQVFSDGTVTGYPAFFSGRAHALSNLKERIKALKQIVQISSPNLRELVLAAYCYLELEYLVPAAKIYTFCVQDSERLRNATVNSEIAALGRWISLTKYQFIQLEQIQNPYSRWDNRPLEFPSSRSSCLQMFNEFILLRKLELDSIDTDPINPQNRYIDALCNFAAGNYICSATAAVVTRCSSAEDFYHCVALEYYVEKSKPLLKAAIASYIVLNMAETALENGLYDEFEELIKSLREYCESMRIPNPYGVLKSQFLTAKRFYINQSYTEALSVCDQFKDVDHPLRVEFQLLEGRVLKELGRYEDARSVLSSEDLLDSPQHGIESRALLDQVQKSLNLQVSTDQYTCISKESLSNMFAPSTCLEREKEKVVEKPYNSRHVLTDLRAGAGTIDPCRWRR